MGNIDLCCFFEEQPRKNSSSQEEGVSFNLLTRLGINVYGQYGDLNYNGKLKDKQVKEMGKGVQVTGKFINQSNAHLRMDVEAQLLKETKVDDEIKTEVVTRRELSSFVVHRGATKKFDRKIKLPIKQGNKVKLIFWQGDKNIYQISQDI